MTQGTLLLPEEACVWFEVTAVIAEESGLAWGRGSPLYIRFSHPTFYVFPDTQEVFRFPFFYPAGYPH